MERLIFLAEAELDLRRTIRRLLKWHNYEVTTFSKSWRVIPAAEERRPALFILSTTLPGEGGLNLCWRIRHHPLFHDSPVILLSPDANESDVVYGFKMGADDYIIKPICLREMTVRIRNLIRRFEQSSEPSSIQAGPFTLDRANLALLVDGRSVPIGRTEFRLLDFLARNPRQAFTRTQLLHAVWGEQKSITQSAVTVQMGHLRRKIEPDPASPLYLQTIHGLGYRFDPEG